jgi:hypothetical protein
MNTFLHLPAIPWLSFAWPRALRRPWTQTIRAGADPAGELDVLSRLDARTLRDIGAPERLLARALARRETQRFHDDLTLGLGASAWRHW